MAHLSEIKRGKLMKIATLSLLLLMFTAMTVTVANAFTYNWSGATISKLQDTDDTPGQGPPGDPWWEDSKGHVGQPESELLWLYVGVDTEWVYVRWDVGQNASEFDTKNMNIYYVLTIDGVAPFDTLEATHLLVLGRTQTTFFIQIVNASDKQDILWTGSTDDYQLEYIDPTEDPNVVYQTAVEARFDRSILPETTFYVMAAETHAAQSGMGSTSEAQDYIMVTESKVPWFTDLGLTLLATTILAVVIKKKKGALPVNIGSGA